MHGNRRWRSRLTESITMSPDNLENDLFAALCAIPLIDPHSHIDPLRPVSGSLDDILGYHYYTELAHSAGLNSDLLTADQPPRDRVRAVMHLIVTSPDFAIQR